MPIVNGIQIPNIIVFIGMPRAGSTTVYHQLSKHPSIFTPYRKETFYFSFFYDRGVDWYLSLFHEATTDQVALDVSPDYFFHSQAINRIMDFNPKTKAILCVRDPVEWILSFYNQRATTDLTILPFEEFLHGYNVRIGNQEVRLILHDGFIIRMIEKCRKAFRNNLLIYDFNLFQNDLLSVLRSIELFVNAPPYFDNGNLENVVLNASNRRNNKFLYALLNHEKFISAIHTLCPEQVLRYCRRRYYMAVAKKEGSSPYQYHTAENIELAENIFSDERKAVAELFSENQIQLGTGVPFP